MRKKQSFENKTKQNLSSSTLEPSSQLMLGRYKNLPTIAKLIELSNYRIDLKKEMKNFKTSILQCGKCSPIFYVNVK